MAMSPKSTLAHGTGSPQWRHWPAAMRWVSIEHSPHSGQAEAGNTSRLHREQGHFGPMGELYCDRFMPLLSQTTLGASGPIASYQQPNSRAVSTENKCLDRNPSEGAKPIDLSEGE
jgi:hypothetical protein